MNTRLEELSAEERDSHERVLNGCEETYVAVRAAYETERQTLTQLQQHIVERLVEVKFNR